MDYADKITKVLNESNNNPNTFLRTIGLLDSDVNNIVVDMESSECTVTYPCINNDMPGFITSSIADRLSKSVINVQFIYDYMCKTKRDLDSNDSLPLKWLIEDLQLVLALVDVFIESPNYNVLLNAIAAHNLPCFVPTPNYDSITDTSLQQDYKKGIISARLYLESKIDDMDSCMSYSVANDLQMITSILDFVNRNHIPIRKCHTCGKLFISKKGNYKYCSLICKQKGYAQYRNRFVSEPLNHAIKNMKQRIKAVDFSIIDPTKLVSPYFSSETNMLIKRTMSKSLMHEDDTFLLNSMLQSVVTDIRNLFTNGDITEKEAVKALDDFGRSRGYYGKKN